MTELRIRALYCLPALLTIKSMLQVLSCLLIASTFQALFAGSAEAASKNLQEARQHGCNLSQQVVTSDGHRNLALVVGIGKYRSIQVKPLVSPTQDAADILNLLKNEMGFPAENICVLLDKAATLKGFREAFSNAIVNRIGSKNDQVFIYFAGHGSLVLDLDGDEPDRDNFDETWLMYNSRWGDKPDLIDDEIAKMLEQAYSKTPYVTLVVDACHSGNSQRSASIQKTEVRRKRQAPRFDSGGGQGKINVRYPETPQASIFEAPPGMVTFAAADDKQPAEENDQNGLFTAAFVATVRELTTEGRPTNREIMASVEARFRSEGHTQSPIIEGDQDRVFVSRDHKRNNAQWRVSMLDGEAIHISGIPMAGYGKGAELDVFADGHGTAGRIRIQIEDFTGISAIARIVRTGSSSDARELLAKIKVGQRVELRSKAADWKPLKIKLDVDPAAAHAAEMGALIREEMKKSFDLVEYVSLVQENWKYNIQVTAERHILVRDNKNVIIHTLLSQTVAMGTAVDLVRYMDFLLQEHVLMTTQPFGGNMYFGGTRSLEITSRTHGPNPSLDNCTNAPTTRNVILNPDGAEELKVHPCQKISFEIRSGEYLDKDIAVIGILANYASGIFTCFPRYSNQARRIFPRSVTGLGKNDHIALANLWASDTDVIYGLVALGSERSSALTCQMFTEFWENRFSGGTRVADNWPAGTHWVRVSRKLEFSK